nr:protein fmp52, mitochondrial [Quercus suber]
MIKLLWDENSLLHDVFAVLWQGKGTRSGRCKHDSAHIFCVFATKPFGRLAFDGRHRKDYDCLYDNLASDVLLDQRRMLPRSDEPLKLPTSSERREYCSVARTKKPIPTESGTRPEHTLPFTVVLHQEKNSRPSSNRNKTDLLIRHSVMRNPFSFTICFVRLLRGVQAGSRSAFEKRDEKSTMICVLPYKVRRLSNHDYNNLLLRRRQHRPRRMFFLSELHNPPPFDAKKPNRRIQTKQGSHILTILTAHPAISAIHAFSRRPPSNNNNPNAKFTTIPTPSDPSTWPAHYPASAPLFFSALGTTARRAGSFARQREIDYDLNLALARAAHARGARVYVLVSTAGAAEGARDAVFADERRIGCGGSEARDVVGRRERRALEGWLGSGCRGRGARGGVGGVGGARGDVWGARAGVGAAGDCGPGTGVALGRGGGVVVRDSGMAANGEGGEFEDPRMLGRRGSPASDFGETREERGRSPYPDALMLFLK